MISFHGKSPQSFNGADDSRLNLFRYFSRTTEAGGIFWKLYLTYSLLFNLSLVLILSTLYVNLRSSLWESTTNQLDEKLSLLTPYAKHILDSPDQPSWNKLIKELGDNSNTRISVIQKNGLVLVDSESSSDQKLSHHSDRPEIIEALKHRLAKIIRFSKTLNQEMYYLAKLVQTPLGIEGILRVSVPVEIVSHKIQGLFSLIALAAISGIILILIVSYFLAKRFTDPITELIQTCEGMIEGSYDKKITKTSRDELGILAFTLNKLGDEISSRINTISLERGQLQSMLSAMVEGIVAVDHQNRILFHNSAASILLCNSYLDLKKEFLTSHHGFSKLLGTAKKARSNLNLIEEELIIHHQQKKVTLEVHASPFLENYGQGVMIVLHDITRVRQLEQVRQDFVANISHEIKTPLTSIKGYVETLLGGALYEEDNNTRFLKKVLSNTNRLTYLVQDILSLARIESDSDNFQPELQAWEPLIRAVFRQYEGSFREKSLKATIESLSGLTVYADREGMIQILDNLVSNAIRYSQYGGEIKIKTWQAGDQGILEVSDTGIGIPEKDMDRIFERFYRVDKDRSRSLGGTGLGLSIVKHLTSGMSGQVSVQSTSGKGSSFFVSLPTRRSV